MQVGARATLKMIRCLRKNQILDKEKYKAEVILYSSTDETITLKVEEGVLARFSLDGVYRCVIRDKENASMCEGTIIERFQNDEGNVIIFHIENGFYKNF